MITVHAHGTPHIHLSTGLRSSLRLSSKRLKRERPYARNVLAVRVVCSQAAEGDDLNPSSGAGQSVLELADVRLARFRTIFHQDAQSEELQKG